MPRVVKNILIGTTLAEGSDVVVKTAFRLARAHGATVHLVHVVPGSSANRSGSRKLFEALMEQAYRAGLEGLYFSLRIEIGSAHPVLERLAAELEADLLVTGTREPGGGVLVVSPEACCFETREDLGAAAA